MASKRIHTDSETPVRVAVYARFSCDKQRDESIEDQVREAKRYCAERNYEIMKVYPDFAISGRSDDRPQFLQMIEDARIGAFDVVLVWKMDRFARNMQDQYYYEKLINDAGVRLESVKEHISGNSIEASMSKGMLAIFAQVRSQQSAEDTMRGMLGKAEKCQYLGIHWFGYSHDGDEIILDPVEAPIAREIHMRYIQGQSQKDIVGWLNRIEVRGAGGKPVGNTFVTGVLKNMVYAGVYTWGKLKDERGSVVKDSDGKPIPLVRVEDGVPAIVTKDEKERCLWRLKYRKHANAKADYMLSGKLFCSECGRPMHGEVCTNHDGVLFYRYCCQGKRKACNGIYWKDQVESAIAKTIRKILVKPDVAELIADGFMKYRGNRKPEATIEALNASLKEIDKQRRRFIKAIEDGIPYKHIKDKMEKLDEQQAVTEKKIAELERAKCEITKADVLQFLELVASGMRTDEELLKAFVSQVWVSENHAMAVMNFQGKTSTPYEINCALKQILEPAGQKQVRESSLWLPPDEDKTNQIKRSIITARGVPVVFLDNGFGIMVTLDAA
ncbi:MAG: recombinase family protein [Eggerthellaceae bacterium]|nr:recombinase family protein [Eggerthellaceae bacterium]